MGNKPQKERIDILLVEAGLYESREKAKAALMAGIVYVNGEPIDKAGTKISKDAQIEVKGAVHPYVGRGGLKLEKAIQYFQLALKDTVLLDIGSSTGGFTDCALQHGAAFVYAIDVGYNQLDWTLRQDERVCVMERTNFRYTKAEHLQGPKPNFAAIDVSFISLQKIFPALNDIFLTVNREEDTKGTIVALIKPQFEAGRDRVGKSGIITDPNVHSQVIMDLLVFTEKIGWSCHGVTHSPIKGGEGNIEFLALWKIERSGAQSEARVTPEVVSKVVADAHQLL